MSQKIGATFLKEFKSYEPPFFWKFTFRQTVLYGGIVLGVVIAYYAYTVQLPEWMIYVLEGTILPPAVIYGLRKEERFLDYLHFRLTVKSRPYCTEKRKEYSRSEFIQSKKVREDERF